MSNYAAMYGGVTNKPQHWPNAQYHFINENRPVHSHYHPNAEAQKQQQQMPEVHPSILTPFIEQVQLKQKEADQKKQQQQHHSVKIVVSDIEKDKHHHHHQHRDQHHHHQSQNQQQHHNPSHQQQHTNHENFEMINDVFSKNLVPPPPSLKPAIFNHEAPQHKKKQQEKLNKFNLTMKSPLQDASRFNYENVVSTNRPTTPNVFVYLNNRTRDNVYKQHKQLHPSYKKKPFLPTPYEPEKNHEIVVANGYEPQHAFFTVDDAVTPNLPPSFVENNKFRERIPVAEEIVENHRVKPTTSRITTSVSSTRFYDTSTTEATPKSTSKPRQKLRRRKPKPKNQQQSESNQNNQEQESINITAAPSRPKYKFVDADDETLKNRNRLNHPTRIRNRFSTQSPAPITLSYTSNDDKEKPSIDITPTSPNTSESTPSKSSEITDSSSNVKRRVKIKYRNKLRTTTSDPSEVTDFNSKNSDNHISESENENFEFHPKFVSDSSTVQTTAAGSHSGLILPNLKFKNEIFTTFPTTAADSTLSSSSSFSPPSTSSIESTVPSKIPRPRFSIKEIKRKQLANSSSPTVATTTTTTLTSTTLDSQRFNRFRASFNRRRNETTELGEENEKKRLYPSRTSTTSVTPTITESSIFTENVSTVSIPRRSSLPKRTFPVRNFTKATVTETETFSTTVKPSRSTAGVTSSRGSFRAKLRKKEPSDEKSSLQSTVDPLKNSNFNYDGNTQDTTFTSTSSTEAPYKLETSIMKIAKTPSSISKPSNIIENDLDDQPSFATPDNDLNVSPSEHMQRVVELTLSGNHQSHDFKSANIGTLSRRIPNYFTISTDDPILPIQAFFPQINTNE